MDVQHVLMFRRAVLPNVVRAGLSKAGTSEWSVLQLKLRFHQVRITQLGPVAPVDAVQFQPQLIKGQVQKQQSLRVAV